MIKLLLTSFLHLLLVSTISGQTFVYKSNCFTGKNGQGNGNYSITYNVNIDDEAAVAWSNDSEMIFVKEVSKNELNLYTTSHISPNKLKVTIPGANANIKFTEETKIILGYKCKKSTAKLGKIRMEFFYTEDVKVNSGVFAFKDSYHMILKNQEHFDINNLPGFVLEYKIEIPYFGTIVSEAIDVISLDSSKPKFKDNYQLLTLEEYFNEFKEYHLPFEKDSLKLNSVAPGFTVELISDKTFNLNEVKDTVIVLNFWFIGCKGCIAEFPTLNKIKSKYQEKAVKFISLAPDTKAVLSDYLKRTPFDYAAGFKAGFLHKLYGARINPTTVIIDKNKKIVYYENISLSPSFLGDKFDENIAKFESAITMALDSDKE